jgi:hypothetical protein
MQKKLRRFVVKAEKHRADAIRQRGAIIQF